MVIRVLSTKSKVEALTSSTANSTSDVISITPLPSRIFQKILTYKIVRLNYKIVEQEVKWTPSTDKHPYFLY